MSRMEARVFLKNSKMGKVMHISLPPIESCPSDAPCAVGCYAMKAWRMYKACRAAWTGNLSMWKEAAITYEQDIINAIAKRKTKDPILFRWHMAGDIPDARYLNMMMRIARRFPAVKFLAFTKRYQLVADNPIIIPTTSS